MSMQKADFNIYNLIYWA